MARRRNEVVALQISTLEHPSGIINVTAVTQSLLFIAHVSLSPYSYTALQYGSSVEVMRVA